MRDRSRFISPDGIFRPYAGGFKQLFPPADAALGLYDVRFAQPERRRMKATPPARRRHTHGPATKQRFAAARAARPDDDFACLGAYDFITAAPPIRVSTPPHAGRVSLPFTRRHFMMPLRATFVRVKAELPASRRSTRKEF